MPHHVKSLGSVLPQVLTNRLSLYVYLFHIFTTLRYISDGAYDTYVTTWVLGGIIWTSEVLGGFDATTMTDAAQSGIMILSFIALPICVSYWYGPVRDASF